MGYGRMEAELEGMLKEVVMSAKRPSGLFVVAEDLDKLWVQARSLTARIASARARVGL